MKISTHVLSHTCVHTLPLSDIHVLSHMHEYTLTCTCMHHTHNFSFFTNMHTHTPRHTCMRTQIHELIHTVSHICSLTHIHFRTLSCMRSLLHTHMPTHMLSPTHVHTHTHTKCRGITTSGLAQMSVTLAQGSINGASAGSWDSEQVILVHSCSRPLPRDRMRRGEDETQSMWAYLPHQHSRWQPYCVAPACSLGDW